MFKPRIQRRHWLGCAIATGMTLMAGLHNSPAWALDAPQGRVILTVSGQIGQTNRDGKAVFDIATLPGGKGVKSFTLATDYTDFRDGLLDLAAEFDQVPRLAAVGDNRWPTSLSVTRRMTAPSPNDW